MEPAGVLKEESMKYGVVLPIWQLTIAEAETLTRTYLR